jgi:DME family drug/metabolite transporter
VALLTGGLGFAVDARSLTLLIALGAVPTALAYVCFFRGLVRVHATTAALTALLEPLTGAVLGALVLGDRLGLAGWLGALVLGVAVVLGARAERSGQRQRSAPEPVPVPEGF